MCVADVLAALILFFLWWFPSSTGSSIVHIHACKGMPGLFLL